MNKRLHEYIFSLETDLSEYHMHVGRINFAPHLPFYAAKSSQSSAFPLGFHHLFCLSLPGPFPRDSTKLMTQVSKSHSIGQR